MFFQLGENAKDPTARLLLAVAGIRFGEPAVAPAAGRKLPLGVVMVDQGERELAEIVFALRRAGCLAGRLHCGEREPHKHADDDDHDQELDECKARGQVCEATTA